MFSDFVFDPEENRGGEIGIKTSLLENSMLATVEVYYYQFSDLQVDFFNDAQFAFVTSNAGGGCAFDRGEYWDAGRVSGDLSGGTIRPRQYEVELSWRF